jgi:hypothetical protein
MLAGLGQIYIEGDVVLFDSQTMQAVASYKISKDFSFGGYTVAPPRSATLRRNSHCPLLMRSNRSPDPTVS